MNYNILAYTIHILLVIFITVFVGRSLHKNGAVLLVNLFDSQAELFTTINNVLIICYYLLNIGIALFHLNQWENVDTINALVANTMKKNSVLILLLGTIHYANLFTFFFMAKRLNQTQ